MSKFFEYVKNIELNSLITESLNTFSYNLPDNRKQRLFDFYSFSSLSPLVNDIQSSELRVVKSFAPKKSEQGESFDDSMEETTSFRGARKLNENFVDSFWKAHDKCYVELAKEMLMDIFYCISAEFKHIDQEQNYRSEKLINKIPEDLREIYKSYISGDSRMSDVEVPEKKGESGNSYNSRYEKAIRSVAMAGKSIFDFAKLCSYVYDNFRFSGAYAGPKWSDAANAFIGIANALPSKYRPASIFKPLKDLKDLKDSTDTKASDSTDIEAPSEEESKKTKYNFDEKLFFGEFENGTEEQQKEISDLIEKIEKHFSEYDTKISWKIVNKTTKEDIIPSEIMGNQIKGKYLFNLLFNHDNFEGYSNDKLNNLVTNTFKDFLDPHKKTLNNVFGNIEGKSKFLQSFNKASAKDQLEIINLAEDLTKYFKDLAQQEISNFEIYDVIKWEAIFIGNKPKSEEIYNLIANYNNFDVLNDNPNNVEKSIHSTIKDNIRKIFDKYKTVLNKLFGKQEETEEPYDDEKTSLLEKEKNVKIFKEKFGYGGNYSWTLNQLYFDLQDIFEYIESYNKLVQVINSKNGIILYTGNKPEKEDIYNLIVSYNNIGVLPIHGSYTDFYKDLQSKFDNTFENYKAFLNNLFGKKETKQTEEDAEEETSNEIAEQKSSGSYELTPKERLALFVAIDHTWGLSHNTGPTFNKLKEFNKLSNDGRGGWLIDALDKRTKDENLFRFINKNTKNSDVSQQMVPIIKRVVYSYYGATNEEELYKYVAKTNPKKQVPVHVSDVVYRNIKGNPIDDSAIFDPPYDIDFKSHYNYWCSLTFKVKYIPTGAVCIIAAHITDHNVTILASDKNDFSFSRDGIQSSGEYVESKNSFALKEGSSNSSAITNTYKKTINEVLGKIRKYNGVRINPDYTSVLGDLEMSFDELKQKINLNSDISLARIAEYGDDLRNSTKVKFQIGDDGLEFIMPHVVMTFVNAERQEETPDVTYGSPDAEEYFSGKRKKPKPAPATSNIRFSFLAKPEISKTFQFTDDTSTNIKNVIYGYVSKINETGDEGLKRLQKSAVEDFNLGTLKIDKIDYHADFFRKSFPEKYKNLFNRIDKTNPDEIKLYGNHNYNFLIKIDKGRLTNPYTVILRKNEDSIVDRSYRYDSIETIEKNFATIVEDMISNIKDSEKQEFNSLIKNLENHSFDELSVWYLNKIYNSNVDEEIYIKIENQIEKIKSNNPNFVKDKSIPKNYIQKIIEFIIYFLQYDYKNNISSIEDPKISFHHDKEAIAFSFYFKNEKKQNKVHIFITVGKDNKEYITINNGSLKRITMSNISQIKEEIDSLLKINSNTKVTQSNNSEVSDNGILIQKYKNYLSDNFPLYTSYVRLYCIKLLEKIAFSIQTDQNILEKYFKKLSIIFKWFYDEIDSQIIDENNFEKAQIDYIDQLEIQFKQISNFLFNIKISHNDDYFIARCGDTKNNKIVLSDNGNINNIQGLVQLAINVNKVYDKMVAEGGTTTQTPQPSASQTNTNGNISSSDITSDYLEFLNKNYPDIKEGNEREFYLIAISSFAKQQGNIVKDFYNNFTKVIKFIYNGIQSNILNNNDLANLESKMSGVKYVIIKFNLKFPLIFKFFNDREKNPYVTIELLKNTPALYTSDFFLDDYVTFDYLNHNTFTFGKKIKDAFSSTENQNLNDSVNLKELLKSFLLKS